MTVIDIGPGAEERASQGAPGYTQISKTNPANETGVITTIEVWVSTLIAGAKVATFFNVSGNNLTARDSAVIGNLSPGKQTISGLNLHVQAGDYLGFYNASGTIKIGAPVGSGRWYKMGDYTTCVNTTFTSSTTSDYAIGGSGNTPGGFLMKGVGIGIGMGIS